MGKLFFSYHSSPLTKTILETVRSQLPGWTVFDYKVTLPELAGDQWREGLIEGLTSSQAGIHLLDPECKGDSYSDYMLQEAIILDLMKKVSPGFFFLPAATGIDLSKDIPPPLLRVLNIDANQFCEIADNGKSLAEFLEQRLGPGTPSDPFLAKLVKNVQGKLLSYPDELVLNILKEVGDGKASYSLLDKSLRGHALSVLLLKDGDPGRLVQSLVEHLYSHNANQFHDILAIMAAARVPSGDLHLVKAIFANPNAKKAAQFRHGQNYLLFWQILRAYLSDRGPLPLMRVVRKFRGEGGAAEWLDPCLDPNPITAAHETLPSDCPEIAVVEAVPQEVADICRHVTSKGCAAIIRRHSPTDSEYEGVPVYGPILSNDEQRMLAGLHRELKRFGVTGTTAQGIICPGHFAVCDLCSSGQSVPVHCHPSGTP